MSERNDDIERKTKTVAAAHTQEKPVPGFSKHHVFIFRKWSTHTKALVALSLVCFFWGTTWIASKEGVRHMPALQMVGIRQLCGGLCYLLFFGLRGNTWPRGKEWRVVLMLCFLNFIMSNGLSTWGVKYISAGLGAVIGAIFPLWLVIIGLFGTRAKIAPKAIAGMLLGFAGICIIFYGHLHDFLNPNFRLGIFVSVLATWTWAFGTIYTKKHATGFNLYFSLGLQMFISGAVLILFTKASGTGISIAHVPWQSWLAILYLVLFGSVVSFAAYLYALKNLPTEQVSLYAYINPVVAVLLGWLLFGEMLTPYMIAGVLLALYGVYLVNKAAVKI